jgi:hypothetical protein
MKWRNGLVALTVFVTTTAGADYITKEVFMVVNSNATIDVFGSATYYDSSDNQTNGRISGNLSLFSGPYQLDTPQLADWSPFIQYGQAAPELRHEGTYGTCYAASITVESTNVPRSHQYTDGSCAERPGIIREPHGYDLCPLLVDLDGGGIRTSDAASPVSFFDVNRDGVREASTWTSGDREDAFLWMDINQNHHSDPGELFGSGMPLPNGSFATNGFAALAAYDHAGAGGDENGIIDRRDLVWHQLRLWVDRNHDGVSQQSETFTPAAAQVIEFGLTRALVHAYDASGNNLMLTGTYKRRLLLHGQPVIGERALVDIAFMPLQP